MKKWEIVNFIKNNIDQFRSTLPLIQMLREKYMRDRHWDKLKQHLGVLIGTIFIHPIFRTRK
jgi:dynein heavy chain